LLRARTADGSGFTLDHEPDAEELATRLEDMATVVRQQESAGADLMWFRNLDRVMQGGWKWLADNEQHQRSLRTMPITNGKSRADARKSNNTNGSMYVTK
jgi:hypothetical protein